MFSSRLPPHGKHHAVKTTKSPKSAKSARKSSLVPMGPMTNNRNPASDMEVPAPRQASTLTQNEIMKNLSVRGIKPTGFWEDDVELLQAEFMKEYQQSLKVRAASLEKEAQSLINQQKQKRAERAEQLAEFEEFNALNRRPELRRWLKLVAQDKCEPSAVFRMRPVFIRCIVKGLPAVSCLRSLQLSRNKLAGRVGRHIAQMLRVNQSLTQLDLSNNMLGPSSVAQLGNALRHNCTLKTLDISSNPITVGNNGRDLLGVKTLTGMMEYNDSLLCLNISSTALGSEGGALLAAGLEHNTSLIILENTNNGIDFKDEKAIMLKLAANRELRTHTQRNQQMQRLNKRRQEILEEKKRIAAEKRAEEEVWIAKRRHVRVEARRQVAEEERERKIEERAKMLERLKAKAEEAERLAKAKSRKKRKGRRKRKKKKKKK